jgi:hypothetical protein
MNFNVIRNGIPKNHGTVVFTALSTTAGKATFTPLTHPPHTFDYSLSGNTISINLSAHLVLSGNTPGHDIVYTHATGTATLDSSGDVKAVSGPNNLLRFTSLGHHPVDGDDTWTAQASEGQHRHGHEHEAKA